MTEPADSPTPASPEPAPAPDAVHAIDAALAGIPEPLAVAIRARGFASLTSVQQAVLDAESEGRDLRISSQTGSGKTVAIGLALARHLVGDDATAASGSRGPRVLVLVPTRELAMQVRDELRWLYAGVRGLGIEVVMGGTSLGLERRALAGRPRIVVGTPGRTLDHLKTGALVVDDVSHVVLDESDRMLDMGFREELEAILEKLPAERSTHLVSATFPASVRKLADRFQRRALHVEGTRLGDANRDIEHVAHLVDKHGAYASIVNLLLLNEGARCLIFVERRVDVTALAERLSGDGFPVQPFSGELPQTQRTRTLNAFRDGTMKTLVSTDVAARGIDVPDIELVIHVDPPENAEAYVHRSGRTGRAGSAGHSVLLVAPRAKRAMERLLQIARIEVSWQPPPSASKVAKQLRKNFRQEMHQRLSADEAPSQQEIDYAKRLLDGRDPATVVAKLLDMAQPKPARAPLEIREPSAQEIASAERTATSSSSARFVTFKINWGSRSGALPNRVLSHICRRGQIKGQLIGALEIGPNETTFDVDRTVAARFGKFAARPDPREPKLRIERVKARGASANRSGPPTRTAKPHGKKPFAGKRKPRAS